MSLFAKITCYPPLGEVTCVQRNQRASSFSDGDKMQLRFTVVLSSSKSFPEQVWEVEIWHNIGNFNWSALSLRKYPHSVTPTVVGKGAVGSYYHYTFSEEINLPLSGGYAKFTVRYRTGPDFLWQWANEQRLVGDGELAISPGLETALLEPSPREQLGRYIDNLADQLSIQSQTSEAPHALLWSITGEVPAAQASQSGTRKVVLGQPSSLIRYFSLVRIWNPWLAPRHGRKDIRLTEDAVLCSFLRSDGKHLLLLAISGISNVLTVFRSTEGGEVIIHSRNDNLECSEFRVLASVADDFEVACCALVYESRKLIRSSGRMAATISDHIQPHSSVGDGNAVVGQDERAQWLTNWYDGLTYCTWNALGQNLTEDKIVDALEILKTYEINIANLIIDDNWQTLDNEGDSQFKRGWKAFEANPEGFPSGIKHATVAIRERYPSIQHIAVWHALMGYWGGISPHGELSRNYKTKMVCKKDSVAGGPMLAVDPEDIHRFYDDFYSFLTSAGIDAVKTDVQFFLDLLEDADDRRRFISTYQDAWSIASLRYFGNRSISCMSLTPQFIFHSHMPTNKPSIVLRNSDDFFPDILESHPWHVFCNAHNTLLTRHLNVIPDWDMFQTSHPYALFHAAARCVSGGPICITDEPGKHDIELINQITAPTTRGNTVILRPSNLGRSLDIYHDYKEGHVLRIGTYNGRANTGSGIVGLFNIKSADVSTLVPLVIFPGVRPDSSGEFIIRSYTTGKTTEVMRPSNRNSFVLVSLEPRGWDILTAYPVHSFSSDRKQGYSEDPSVDRVAVLGLLGKMTGVAAIVNSDIYVTNGGRLRCDISLKALGILGIYVSNLKTKSIDQHIMVTISERAISRQTIWKDGGDGSNILAIDVLTAWRELELNSGWSNEVTIRVFVS
ncbi:hypothetical protein Egran_03426 [Elaphomyces granulatus]|uniref:Uncharacterized protein n=1 Tax=Elaphomyces granulatus TaxID=519963 RepID=A0A232LXP6_9EURO|nr:hypothetical protein Egran_03426 [Elaphomyces granulatus]